MWRVIISITRTWRVSKSVPASRLSSISRPTTCCPPWRIGHARILYCRLPIGLDGGTLLSISVRRWTCTQANRLRCVLSSSLALGGAQRAVRVQDRDLLVRDEQRAGGALQMGHAAAHELFEIVAGWCLPERSRRAATRDRHLRRGRARFSRAWRADVVLTRQLAAEHLQCRAQQALHQRERASAAAAVLAGHAERTEQRVTVAQDENVSGVAAPRTRATIALFGICGAARVWPRAEFSASSMRCGRSGPSQPSESHNGVLVRS